MDLIGGCDTFQAKKYFYEIYGFSNNYFESGKAYKILYLENMMKKLEDA